MAVQWHKINSNHGVITLMWKNVILAKFKSGKKSVLFMVVFEFKIWK